MTKRFSTSHCVNPDCGGSGWVSETRTQEVRRYQGRFISTQDTNITAALPPHLQVDVPGKPQDAKFSSDGSFEIVEVETDYAVPCPDCNAFTRSVYEDGRLPYLLAHRNDKPDEEEVRRQNIEKAKAKWDF